MYESITEDVLPQALAMGVEYDLFWTLTPESLQPFTKAFKLKQEFIDAEAWQHGVYVQMAVASVLSKDVKYPERPMSDTDKVEPMDRNEKIKETMMERMAIINSRFEKEGETINESE